MADEIPVSINATLIAASREDMARMRLAAEQCRFLTALSRDTIRTSFLAIRHPGLLDFLGLG